MKLEDIPEEQREKLRQNIRSFFPAREKVTEDNKRIFEALSKKSPVPVHVRESPTSLYSGGGAFHFGEKEPDFIELHPLASEHPATLAHELGHAYFRKESPYAKYIQNRLTAGAHVLSLPISQAAGYAAGLGLKTPAKYLVAPLTALALNAPRLYDEHQAWNRAERLLKAENATPEDMAYAAALRKRALTSYWVVPAASALTGLSTTGLGSYLKTKLANAPVANRSLWEALLRTPGVKIDTSLENPWMGFARTHSGEVYVSPQHAQINEAFPGLKGRILFGKNPVLRREHILAHELGHIDLDRTPLGRVVQNDNVNWLFHNNKFTNIYAPGVQQGLSDTENPGTRAAIYSLLTSAPRLTSEVGASYLGHKLLKGHGATPQQLANYRRGMLGAFGSYALNAGKSALTAAALAKGIRLARQGISHLVSDTPRGANDTDALKTAAAKTVLAHYGLHKLATAPDSNVHQDVGAYRFNRTAESADIDDSKQYVFKAHDRKPQVTGNESAHAVPFLEGVSG